MPPGDALGIVAQISVTLVGFTGIVVAFGARAVHQWSTADRFRLQMLLTTSVLPLVFSVAGLLLVAVDVPLSLAWALGSGVTGTLLLVSGGFIFRGFMRLPRSALEQAGASRILFYTMATTGLSITALQFYNAIALRAFWPFLLSIVTAMLICVIQFVRLVLYHPGRV
jgi:hypothetical protein